ncbi:MAG: LLM class flavin-dependent oxidoreductase, partial [Sciscionella sp.]|nr:LLM class flavin-dependent oxidoreductase [Sciscionella sp.]
MTAQSGTPLAVLDLVPVTEGGTAAQALRNSIDLARQAERFGYARYWVAEHHLNAGVAGTSPAVVLGPIAAATTTIRVGSGAVQLGHRTALSTVEEFGLLDALYPGRVDLGLGRSGGTPPRRDPAQRSDKSSAEAATPREVNGVLIPKPFDTNRLLASPRVELQRELLLLPDAKPQDYAEQIDDLLALLRGDYRADDGRGVDVVPGAGADVQPWLMGSSGGQSARVAGQRGLRFAVAYHVAPAGV